MKTLLKILLVASLLVIFSQLGGAIKDKSLMLYLPFDNTLKDLSGKGNDGVFGKGNPEWAGGKFGEALLIKQDDFWANASICFLISSIFSLPFWII